MKVSRQRGGGRGARGGGRGANQTQDYPYTPPLPTRYATRSSTLVAPGLLPRSPQLIASRSPSLRPALRVLKEEDVGCCSLPKEDDIVHENTVVEDIKSSTQTGSHSMSGPFTEQEIELDVSQPPREKSSEVQCHEKTLAKCITEDVLPSSSRCLSQARSFNLTEYARGLQEDTDEDPEEVQSDPNHVYVQGHRVKREIAGLVRAIFDKYGNLTRETEASEMIISIFLESVCDIYQRLERTKFLDLMIADINVMIDGLQFFQKENLEVRWLLEKLHHIYETKSSILKYSKIKGEIEKCVEADKRVDMVLEQSQRHIDLIQKKMSAAQEEKMAIEAKANEYKKMAIDIRANVNALANQSLVHGLL